MSRLLTIAVREYLAYVRTVGFWLSLCLMPLVLALSSQAPALLEKSSPKPVLTIVDLATPDDCPAEVQTCLYDPVLSLRRTVEDRLKASTAYVVVAPPAPLRAARTPEAVGAEAKRLLGGARPPGDGRIDAAGVVYRNNGRIAVDVWSRDVADRDLTRDVQDAVSEWMRRVNLQAQGLDPMLATKVMAERPEMHAFSPKAAGGGAVTDRDRLPGLIGFGLGLLLWSAVMTGAGILLNSVIEEKSSRILEILLASASTTEIMGGKILGVAGVTFTVLAAWAAMGTAVLGHFAPALLGDVAAVLLSHGLLAYFAAYLVAGYLMYAALFAAVGAYCETTRDAQTLLGPVMLILAVPIIFMGQAISRPDAPLLQALSWVPPFTPFLMAARAASHPPAWQIALTLIEMVAATALVLWIAGRAFRAGALSSGRPSLRALIGSVGRGDETRAPD
ncbi:ABC transporter permease [Caulobacter sp. CCUG 60055]|uniref:ABC transporter permease n=1 Tax=Caulobacter sp. CCUG 60055 TaxID=2100090 RepID=UPI001FA6EEE9|nr:ABC transporter permease [Caulobacter sp. CCUG 60055]MBQ1543002.1 ABC transporter permease [Caulobacteraceae bacterium]MCI3180094.1 ABC transporter permease [Caulobacter sp. CCUG 60055]